MTEPEVMLWSRLRGRGPDKPTFRRQHPFRSLIVDVYRPAARLAIEVEREQQRLAPSTIGPSLRSADGPPPAASRVR